MKKIELKMSLFLVTSDGTKIGFVDEYSRSIEKKELKITPIMYGFFIERS